jgi:hypothetical protein
MATLYAIVRLLLLIHAAGRSCSWSPSGRWGTTSGSQRPTARQARPSVRWFGLPRYPRLWPPVLERASDLLAALAYS